MLFLLTVFSLFVQVGIELNIGLKLVYTLLLLAPTIVMIRGSFELAEHITTYVWPILVVGAACIRLILMLFRPPFVDVPAFLNSADAMWCLVLGGYLFWTFIEVMSTSTHSSVMTTPAGSHVGVKYTSYWRYGEGSRMACRVGAGFWLIMVIFAFFSVHIAVNILALLIALCVSYSIGLKLRS